LRRDTDTEALIVSKYAARPKVAEWPPNFAFFFHVRNAAFHGGRFKIRDSHWPPSPAPGNPETWARWQHYVFDDPVDFVDRPVFGDGGLLSVADVLPLLFDLGNAIDGRLGPLEQT
jgi:hypothetical protein